MKSIRLLVVALAVLIICGTGIALGAQDASESGDLSTTASKLSEAPREIAGSELVSKRTASSRTFVLPTGARETRIFANPVNYQDSEGHWHPIGKGLEETATGFGGGSNGFDLSLPRRLGAGQPVHLSIGDQWIAYTPLGTTSELGRMSGDTATYESADGGVTFTLLSLTNGLKENIEIDGPSQPSTFHFELSASAGLTLARGEDGSIEFLNKGSEAVASLPAPVLSDGATPNPAISRAVHYKLEGQGEGRWVLSVEADRDWLSQPNRVWPATIDPSVIVVPKPTLDCEIFNGPLSETNLCGESGWQTLGAKASYHSSGGDEYARSLLSFATTSIPKNAFISSATLGLYAPSEAHNTSGAEIRNVGTEVHNAPEERQWTNLVNWHSWKKSALWTKEGGDYGPTSAVINTSARGAQAGWWNFSSESLTTLVRHWQSGATINQGVLFKLVDEGSHECAPSCIERSLGFDSSAAEESKRPYLSVIYYPPAPKTSKLNSPSEGTVTARRLKLKAAWSVAGVTGVTFQFREGSKEYFKVIPPNLIRNAQNQEVSWPIATEGAKTTAPLYFDAAHGTSTLRSKGGPIQVRALFDGPTGVEGYSAPINATVNRFIGGPRDATASVGPGTVDLLTGNFTTTDTDVSIPGFKSAFEFSRTFSSRDAGKPGVLGPGWTPGAPVEQAGGAEWKSVKLVTFSEEFEEETYSFSYAVVTDLEGYEFAFEKNGESYATPAEAAGWVLAAEGPSKFVLTDPAGNRTTFENSAGGSEYLPVSVSQLGGSGNATQMVYQLVNGLRRLSMIIAPTPAGFACSEGFATTTTGCHALSFTYASIPSGGERLSKITYYAPGNGGPWEVANYSYNSEGRLTEEWDPRLPALKETYSYEAGGQIKTITPPGQEPWTFEYGSIDEELANGRLIAVKRPSLLGSPSIAQTTITYQVPVTGGEAPYDLGGSAVAQWGQQDLPVDATAIFPPDQIPASPPSSYSRASVYYMDAEGQLVNTATPSGAGTSAPSITTSEADEFGNVIRELSAQNRLRALGAGAESVARSHELETKRLFSADGTQMEEEWGASAPGAARIGLRRSGPYAQDRSIRRRGARTSPQYADAPPADPGNDGSKHSGAGHRSRPARHRNQIQLASASADRHVRRPWHRPPQSAYPRRI